MIKRFLSFCNRYQLISPQDNIFVGVSGGADSIVLLDLLLSLQKKFPFAVRAVHVNHGIRGAEADRDEYFVRSFCAKRRVELRVIRLQGLGKQSSEAQLREARYEAFESLLREFPSAKLATAHNLDDAIETFFMRLAKGSSLKGLRSIPVKRGPYIRPLLFLRRAEIEKYAQERKLSFVQDSSNRSMKYLRNQIRHQLLPVLVDIFGASFYDGFAKSLNAINEFYSLFETEFRLISKDIVHKHGMKIEINAKKYKGLSALYRYRLIDYCISAYYPLNYSFSKTYLQEIDRFARQARIGAVLNVYKDVFLLRDRKKLIFAQKSEHGSKPVLLPRETKKQFGAFEVEIKKVSRDQVRFSNEKNVEYVCGDKLRFPLIVRYWQPGDRFYPLGMGKSQKLKEFFVNQKIDVWTKNEIPLVCNGEEIIWVAGYRLDERYRLNEHCKTIYRLKIKTIGKKNEF